MYQGAYYGVEDSGHGQDDRYKIQGHGEGQIAFYRKHHSSGEQEKVGDFFYCVVNQCYVGGVYGDVAANASHCNSYAGFFKRRGIIDSITYHAD